MARNYQTEESSTVRDFMIESSPNSAEQAWLDANNTAVYYRLRLAEAQQEVADHPASEAAKQRLAFMTVALAEAERDKAEAEAKFVGR